MSAGQDDDISYSRTILTGAGFFADAYDLFVINIAVDLMGKSNYHEQLTTEMKSTIKSMALAGAIVGQLFFGSMADLIGRRKVFIMTCSMVIIGALLSSLAQDTQGSFGIYSQLCFWRFILGRYQILSMMNTIDEINI
jgi:PHS family inorganic phosphate transporter-like MFS transporter